MRNREQSVIDADAPELGSILARHVSDEQRRWLEDPVAGERAARRSLRGQIAKLEHELSAIVAETFPHIAAPGTAVSTHPGPCLLGLEELESGPVESGMKRLENLRYVLAEAA